MSATFQVQSQGFSTTQRQLLQLVTPDFQQELLGSVGALVESRTRQRIQEDKTGPDGKVWAKWSERYLQENGAAQRMNYRRLALSSTDIDATDVDVNISYELLD